MNGSFERFALSDERRGEIKHFEQEHIASAWDSFRFPFVAAMVGGCLFLVVTQKQLFDSTIASLGAVATTVPAVVRAIGLSREHGMAQNQSRTSDERRA